MTWTLSPFPKIVFWSKTYYVLDLRGLWQSVTITEQFLPQPICIRTHPIDCSKNGIGLPNCSLFTTCYGKGRKGSRPLGAEKLGAQRIRHCDGQCEWPVQYPTPSRQPGWYQGDSHVASCTDPHYEDRDSEVDGARCRAKRRKTYMCTYCKELSTTLSE